VSQAIGNSIGLSIEQAREGILLVEWSAHSLSFSVFSPKSNTVLYSGVSETYFDLFDYNEQEFGRLISEEQVFQYSFSKTIFLINSHYYTLIPSELLDENHMDSILALNVKLPSGNLLVEKVELDKSPYTLVYALPKTLFKTIQNNFINFEVITAFPSVIKVAESSVLHAHVSEESVTILYQKEGELTFLNTFKYDAPEDLVYNILNVYQQLGLHHEKDMLNLTGSIARNSEYFELLYKYIKDINFPERSVKLNYSEAVQAMPSHYFVHHYSNFI
jgi:hypothetical protein